MAATRSSWMVRWLMTPRRASSTALLDGRAAYREVVRGLAHASKRRHAAPAKRRQGTGGTVTHETPKGRRSKTSDSALTWALIDESG